MKKINYKGRCEKRKVSKCKDICRTYSKIQSALVNALEKDKDVVSFECNVCLEGVSDNMYEVVMVIPTVDLDVDVSMGKTINFTTQPRLIQDFDKATGNNLIWYDEQSAKANAPVCKNYNF